MQNEHRSIYIADDDDNIRQVVKTLSSRVSLRAVLKVDS